MGVERNIVCAVIAVASIVGAAPAFADPKEPLIVTQMADPDPYYVPPAPDGKHRQASASADADESVRIEEAMQDFGRAIGQAAMVEQQQIEARCRSGHPESATPEQRFAWAARCRYSRH